MPVALFHIEIIRVEAALRVEASERREKRHLRRVGQSRIARQNAGVNNRNLVRGRTTMSFDRASCAQPVARVRRLRLSRINSTLDAVQPPDYTSSHT